MEAGKDWLKKRIIENSRKNTKSFCGSEKMSSKSVSKNSKVSYTTG